MSVIFNHIISNTNYFTCRSTRTHYPDSEPTSLCTYSLMLHVWRRSNKYPCYNLWHDWGSNPQSTTLGLARLGLEPTIYYTRGEHANNYTIYAILKNRMLFLNLCVHNSLYILYDLN